MTYVVQAVTKTSRWTTAKIDAIRRLQGGTTAHVQAQLPDLYSHELLDVIFQQPYCRIANR